MANASNARILSSNDTLKHQPIELSNTLSIHTLDSDRFSGHTLRSPARDQQLMLERLILHSLSARETTSKPNRSLMKAIVVLGISATLGLVVFGSIIYLIH